MRKLTCLAFALSALIACGDDSPSGGSAPTGGSNPGGSPPVGGSGEGGTPSAGGGGANEGGAPVGGAPVGGAAAFELTSSAYTEGQTIPEVYECQNGGGDNISMPLAWTAGPPGTMSYAIVMRDLDFNNGFEHWAIWDIPGSVLALPEDVEHTFEPSAPAGAKQAQNGYLGPCSPNSVNTYQLTLYAIPTATIVGLDESSSKAEAAQAITDAAIAEATLSGES